MLQELSSRWQSSVYNETATVGVGPEMTFMGSLKLMKDIEFLLTYVVETDR